MGITRHCAELLEAGQKFHYLYGNRLANHLPMALIALDRLGATQAQLQGYFDKASTRLQPIEASAGASDLHFPALRGRGEHYFLPAKQFFQEQIAAHGREKTIREFLPRLLPSIATSAFHAMIRLAYAVDARHAEETAAALAYWTVDYQEFPSNAETKPHNCARIIADVTERYPKIEFSKGIIVDHMLDVVRQPDWMQTKVQPENINLEDIARVALDAYLGTGDFTLLHGVTSCHAMRLLLPFCDNPRFALRCYWEGLVVAYLSTGPKPVVSPELNREELPGWNTLIQGACASSNDHRIKLTYSCHEESAHYGWPEYQAAAAMQA
ncbi:questin oxidase family protein [Biformimicrobium ophioploci]|uniref:Questin oxidase family protein n=1 Tax=Biformimicrobium ophioploci TaxID=3036711 RepID=A0ABQ6M168_9GAMM|nr:questin oxidase family protein [Microbulbifer sp. NKW57]GMG88027.1 questin oxidase family protein [Microbulbifer sp. NKW57]